MKKIAGFASSVLADVICESMGHIEHSKILDMAWGFENDILFAQVIPSESDSSSINAVSIATFKDRESEASEDCGGAVVYITPRNRSIFGGTLNQVEQLFDEGYKIYLVDEYEHSNIALRLLSDTSQKKGAVMSGSFRNKFTKSCQFDSSFAFLACPKSSSKPTQAFLDEFENWMNGVSYAFRVLRAELVTTESGATKYEISEIETCHGFYADDYVEEAALDELTVRAGYFSKAYS